MSPFFDFPEVFFEKMCVVRGDALVFYVFEVFSEEICSARKDAPAFCSPEIFSEKMRAREYLSFAREG